MSNQTIEAYDEEHAIDIMSHFFRSYDMLALQAVNRNDGVSYTKMCDKRDAAYREYMRLTNTEGAIALMGIIQPSGLI